MEKERCLLWAPEVLEVVSVDVDRTTWGPDSGDISKRDFTEESPAGVLLGAGSQQDFAVSEETERSRFQHRHQRSSSDKRFTSHRQNFSVRKHDGRDTFIFIRNASSHL